MLSVMWSPGLKFDLDPSAVEDFQMDFSRWLEGEPLADATVTSDDATAVLQLFTSSGVVSVRVSGGVVGVLGMVSVVATSLSGRVTERSFYIRWRKL